MIGISPLSAFGARNLQSLQPLGPVRAVKPVVRESGGKPSAANTVDNADKVTLRGNSPRASEGLYARQGTLITSTERQQSFDLTVKTAEGDIATLRFSQASGSSSAVRAQSSEQGSSVETLQESYGTLDLQIQLQGSFNAEETQAMDQLMQQANRVADEFFAGDMETATAQAGAMGLSGTSLQSFSMDLHSQEMRRVSATYEEVARYTAPASVAQAPAPSADSRGTDLLQSLKQLLAQLVNDVQNTKP